MKFLELQQASDRLASLFVDKAETVQEEWKATSIPVPVWFFRGRTPRKNQTGTGMCCPAGGFRSAKNIPLPQILIFREKPKWERYIRRHGANYGQLQHDEVNLYFDQVEGWDQAHKEFFAESQFDPFHSILETIRETGRTPERLYEPKYNGNYGAGVLKIGGSNLIHYDQAWRSLQEFELGKITTQIGFTLILRAPESKGEVTVYKATPDTHPSLDGIGDSISETSLDNAARFAIMPRIGHLHVINTQYWHIISPPKGQRISANLFLELDGEGKYYYWS